MVKSSSMKIDGDVKRLIEDQINILFRLTHHKVFKIQLKTLMLLYQFAKASQRLDKGFELKVQEDKESQDEGDTHKKDGKREGNFADRFYRTLYELILKVHVLKAATH